MATNLTTTALAGKTGITDTLASADATGNYITSNNGKTWLEVNNASGASITVTINAGKTFDGNAVTAPTVSVGASARKKIGPFDPSVYNDSSDRVLITYSAVTSVTVAAYSFS